MNQYLAYQTQPHDADQLQNYPTEHTRNQQQEHYQSSVSSNILNQRQSQNEIGQTSQSNIAGFDDAYNQDAYQSLEVTPEMLELQRRDQDISQNLQRKLNLERQLKQKKKQKAIQQLQKFKSDRSEQTEKTKENNRIKKQDSRQSSTKANPWQKIVQNIALKEGERIGAKNVTRMKDAIISKSKDNAKQ